VNATAQIFLSYAREDRQKVESLYQRLSDAGFRPWMDIKNILPGEKWQRSIQHALQQSQFFLACLERFLEAGRRWSVPKTSGMCRDILKWREALWTFGQVDGVEPTHNAAERSLQPGVLWRQGSFGTHSEEGSCFVESLMTVVTTLQQQQRTVLEYLTEACEAALRGAAAPSLLPPNAQKAQSAACVLFLQPERVPDPELLDQVTTMLTSPAWPVRQGAARTLIAMPGGPPPYVLPILRGLLDDMRGEESWPQRLQVAELLINDRDQTLSRRAIAVALKALDYTTELWYNMPSSGPSVRGQAARILGQLELLYRDEAIFARLTRILTEDASEDVRDAA
jgi:hypothetical protein